jgi:penicillin amidase
MRARVLLLVSTGVLLLGLVAPAVAGPPGRVPLESDVRLTHAQDRLWQAEVFRRSGAGTLAEIRGPAGLPADLEIRREGYTDAEYEAMWAQTSERSRTITSAYVDGINAWIAQARANPQEHMPIEFFQVGFPADWTELDVLRAGVFFIRRFGETGGIDIVNADLLQSFGPAVFEDLRWLDDPDAYATNPQAGSPTPGNSGGFTGTWDGPDLTEVADHIAARSQQFTDTLIELGVPHKGGSNAWAVAPWKTEGDATRLLGGPQMGYTIPQITHEIGLHGAGFDSQGMAFAGVSPIPLIGRGKHFAWTSTTGVGDTKDHVVELLGPCQDPPATTDPGQVATPLSYWHDGQCRQTEVHTETIAVAGKAPVQVHVHRTVHGPVVALDPSSNIAVAVERVHWMRELDTTEAFIGFNLARTWRQFEEAARGIWTNHNFVYNDRRGTTGYLMTGRLPVRPEGVDPRLPRLGDGSQEWQGFEEIVPLTAGTNPTQGFFVNWNNKPVPGWDNGDIGVAFGPTHRVGVLASELEADDAVSWDDMNRINQVGGSTEIEAFFLRPMLLRAAEVAGGGVSADTREALDLLTAWDGRRADGDGDGAYDAPGLSIFRAWHDAMLEELFGHVDYTDLGDPPPPEGSGDVLWRLFVADADHPGDPALPIHADWLAGRDVDTVAIEVLEAVVADHVASAGPVSAWLTPVRIQRYTPLGALPSVQHPFLNRGTYNQIIEFTRSSSRSVNVNPPGQSGFVQFPGVPAAHTTDQLELYATWQYKDQHLDPLRPIGTPPGQD